MKNSQKLLFLIFFIGLGILSFFTIKKFLTPILLAALIAYIFNPVHKYLEKRFQNKEICAIGSSIMIVLLISLPTIFLAQSAVDQATTFYSEAKEKINQAKLIPEDCEVMDSYFCNLLGKVKEYLAKAAVKDALDDSVQKFTNFIFDKLSQFVFAIPDIALNIFVTMFVTYYFFRDGDKLKTRAKNLLPLNKRLQTKVMDKLNNITFAIIYGSVLIALIQGFLGGIGFWIFGARAPVLAGALIAIFAFIPMFGTALVWVPISGIMMAEGFITGETGLLIRGIGLFLYGIFVISTIDNILKPKIISGKACIHPVIILIGVLGGLSFFGFLGFVLGPLILAMFIAMLNIYETEKK